MDILKEKLGSEAMNALNCDLIDLTLLRRKKPIMSARNRRRVLENLMRCVERADVPEELAAAVYFALCYST